jgi:hypothetical protein
MSAVEAARSTGGRKEGRREGEEGGRRRRKETAVGQEMTCELR